MTLPTPDECIKILKDAGCDENVIKHCKVVSELAVKIAERIQGVNLELVRVGGLLHDLGRAKTHGIKHAVEGAILAEKYGLQDDLLGIIRNHIGAGLTSEEAAALGLPEEDYIPITLEQKIVSHADNLVDYFTPVPISDTLTKLEKRGLMNAAEKVSRLHEELSKIAGMNLNELV
jgi:uncharacterized protein